MKEKPLTLNFRRVDDMRMEEETIDIHPRITATSICDVAMGYRCPKILLIEERVRKAFFTDSPSLSQV